MSDNDKPYSLRKHGETPFPEGLPPTTRKKFQFTDPPDANATVDSGVGKSLIHPEYTSDEDSEEEPTVKNSNNSDLDNLSANTLNDNSENNSVIEQDKVEGVLSVQNPIDLNLVNQIHQEGLENINNMALAANQNISLNDALTFVPRFDGVPSELTDFLNCCNDAKSVLPDVAESNLTKLIYGSKLSSKAGKDAFKNNTDTSVSGCFVQNLRNEIDQRMPVCANAEEALQNAINIERKLNARKELRREPKEKKSNEEKKKSDEKIKNSSKSVNFTTGSQNKPNKPSTSQNNNKNKNNNYQNFNSNQNRSGKKQPTDTRCQNIGSIERRRFRVMKVKLNLDLDNLPYAVVGKSSKTGDVIMMLDSGASPNLIKAKYLSDNTKIDLNNIIDLHGISNVPVFTLGSVTIKLFDRDAVCHVVPNDMTIPHAGLVGSDFFAKHGAKIDYKNRVLEEKETAVETPKTSLQEKEPTVGTPKTPLQGTVGAPTKKRGRPPKHREKSDEKRIDPSEVMPSLDLDVNVESDANSDDESSSSDSDSSIETINDLKREEGNKATNIIATKDLFQYRHDNMVYFLNGDGQPCDEGARSLKSIGKLPNVGFIDTGQVYWTKKGNTNHFGLVIRGTSGESIIRVRSNIAKCLVKLKGILKDKRITNFSIAFSEFIENLFIVMAMYWGCSEAIIGYDCGSKILNMTTISLVDIDECDIEENRVETSLPEIALLQLNEYQHTNAIQCKIEIHRVIQHCGWQSYNSIVSQGINEYIYPISRELCQVAHDHKTLRIGNTFIDGLEINTTTKKCFFSVFVILLVTKADKLLINAK
ncbi:Protein of unknown function [Cotesia congregata]|uniref:Peptidase A2 domain-containing protein n=1 Tax=Cotesia congregata TaxID=51543 RepID=A0A8J2MNF4_COTCN|nr:Protein of unknown function [Cotesia congregata]